MYSELTNTFSIPTYHILTLGQDPSGIPLAWLSVVCHTLIFQCAGYFIAFNEKPLLSHRHNEHGNVAMMKLHIGLIPVINNCTIPVILPVHLFMLLRSR